MFGLRAEPKHPQNHWSPPLDGAWLITTLLPLMCYRTKFRRSRSNRFGVIMEIHQRILTPCVPHLKVSQGHWNYHRPIGQPPKTSYRVP